MFVFILLVEEGSPSNLDIQLHYIQTLYVYICKCNETCYEHIKFPIELLILFLRYREKFKFI